MNLSDAWVTIILISDYTTRERFEKWSVVFSSKYVKSYYRNKGRVAKTFSTIRNEWVYLITNNIYQLFDSKEVSNESEKVIKIENGRLSAKSDLSEGDRYHIQGNFYEYRKAIPSDTSETSFKIKHKISKSSLTAKRFKLSEAKSSKFIEKRKVNTIKRLNIEKRKNEKLTDIKLAPIFNVSDVSDSKDEESKKNTFIEIIRKLRQQLRQAKEKVIYLTTTLSTIHGVIESLIVRTSRASTLLKTAVKL